MGERRIKIYQIKIICLSAFHISHACIICSHSKKQLTGSSILTLNQLFKRQRISSRNLLCFIKSFDISVHFYECQRIDLKVMSFMLLLMHIIVTCHNLTFTHVQQKNAQEIVKFSGSRLLIDLQVSTCSKCNLTIFTLNQLLFLPKQILLQVMVEL